MKLFKLMCSFGVLLNASFFVNHAAMAQNLDVEGGRTSNTIGVFDCWTTDGEGPNFGFTIIPRQSTNGLYDVYVENFDSGQRRLLNGWIGVMTSDYVNVYNNENPSLGGIAAQRSRQNNLYNGHFRISSIQGLKFDRYGSCKYEQ